jgi:hypothetical protein
LKLATLPVLAPAALPGLTYRALLARKLAFTEMAHEPAPFSKPAHSTALAPLRLTLAPLLLS